MGTYFIGSNSGAFLLRAGVNLGELDPTSEVERSAFSSRGGEEGPVGASLVDQPVDAWGNKLIGIHRCYNERI